MAENWHWNYDSVMSASIEDAASQNIDPNEIKSARDQDKGSVNRDLIAVLFIPPADYWPSAQSRQLTRPRVSKMPILMTDSFPSSHASSSISPTMAPLSFKSNVFFNFLTERDLKMILNLSRSYKETERYLLFNTCPSFTLTISTKPFHCNSNPNAAPLIRPSELITGFNLDFYKER